MDGSCPRTLACARQIPCAALRSHERPERSGGDDEVCAFNLGGNLVPLDLLIRARFKLEAQDFFRAERTSVGEA